MLNKNRHSSLDELELAGSQSGDRAHGVMMVGSVVVVVVVV
jgi:hypothetical protein